MSGLFQKKEKLHREPVRWKKELKLAPGYLILTLWILFTLALLGWVLLASFSTTKEIFSNKLLDSGFHIENYVKAWVNSNVSTIFFNSLFYAAVSCTLLILICAPAAYALSRFDFVCNKLIQSSLVASMGVPVVMIVLPLFAVVAGLNILNNVSANRATLIFLYIISLIFGNSDKVRPVAVGLYSMINSMKYTGDWAGMFSAVVIVFLPTFILYIFLSEKIIAGVTGGGVKG